MMLKSASAALVLGLGSGMETVAIAQCELKLIAKLSPPPFAGAYFTGLYGPKVALDGSTLFVSGVQTFGPPVFGSAAVLYEFRESGPSTWSSGQTLVAPGYGHINQTIDLDGDRLCAGFDQSGAIVIYERTNGIWGHKASIPPSIVPGGYWQSTAAQIRLNGDRLMVSVPEIGPTLGLPIDTGAIFFLEYLNGTWSYTSTVLPNQPFGGGAFGREFEFDSNRLVASAGEPLSTFAGGVVYVFDLEGGNWIQKARLIPNDFATSSGVGTMSFGRSIAIDSDRVIVGAYPQALYSFSKFGPFWLQTQKFSAPAALSIGNQVALANDRAIAAIGASVGASGAGALVVFESSGASWIDRMLLTTTPPIAESQLGNDDIRASEDLVVATSADGNTYLFSTVPNPAPEYGTGCPGTGGFIPLLEDVLSYDGCSSDGSSVSYAISKGLGGSTALLMLGTQSASLSLTPNCHLLLVPTPSTITLPLFGTGPGNGSITLNASIPVGFPATSIFFQAFILDQGAAGAYCATNGLRLTVL